MCVFGNASSLSSLSMLAGSTLNTYIHSAAKHQTCILFICFGPLNQWVVSPTVNNGAPQSMGQVFTVNTNSLPVDVPTVSDRQRTLSVSNGITIAIPVLYHNIPVAFLQKFNK